MNGRSGQHQLRRPGRRHRTTSRAWSTTRRMAVGAREAEPAGASRGSARSPPSATRWGGRAAGSLAATSRTRRRGSAATRTSWSGSGGWPRVARTSAADTTAYGVKIDYPNDLWDIALSSTSASAGTSIRRSGFVPAAGRAPLSVSAPTIRPRLDRGPIQQMFTSSSRRGDGPDRPVGELPRLLRAGELALPQRRPLRVQRESRPANGWRRRSRWPTACVDPARLVPLERIPARGGHGRRSAGCTRRSRGGSAGSTTARCDQFDLDRRVEPRRRSSPWSSPASRTSAACRGRLHADPRRHAAAPERVAGPVGVELRAVRHRQPSRSASTRACAGPSAPVGDLFVVYNHNVRVVCRIAGSSTRTSCSSSCSTRFGTDSGPRRSVPASPPTPVSATTRCLSRRVARPWRLRAASSGTARP